MPVPLCIDNLSIVNLALGLLKLLATYGAKAFATFDALRSLLDAKGGEDEGEAIVAVREAEWSEVRRRRRRSWRSRARAR